MEWWKIKKKKYPDLNIKNDYSVRKIQKCILGKERIHTFKCAKIFTTN